MDLPRTSVPQRRLPSYSMRLWMMLEMVDPSVLSRHALCLVHTPRNVFMLLRLPGDMLKALSPACAYANTVLVQSRNNLDTRELRVEDSVKTTVFVRLRAQCTPSLRPLTYFEPLRLQTRGGSKLTPSEHVKSPCTPQKRRWYFACAPSLETVQ